MNIKTLAEKAENLVFDIGQQAPYKDLHNNALRLLKDIYEIESQLDKKSKTPNSSSTALDDESKEIQKAERKLAKWAKNQTAAPAKILTAYLNLKRGRSVTHITRGILEAAVGEKLVTFSTNFHQMKGIYEKNHAKIFDVDSRGIIKIWKPIEIYVQTYEQEVFSSKVR